MSPCSTTSPRCVVPSATGLRSAVALALLAFGLGIAGPAQAGSPFAFTGALAPRDGATATAIVKIRAPRERETDAQRMLDLIRQSLSRGDRATAEGQFEILQARHPDSDAFTEARRLMDATTARATSAPEQPAAFEQPVRPDAPMVAPPPRTTKPWTTEVRRVRAMTQDFQATTGDRIFFGEASAELGSRAKVVLAMQAEWLKRFSNVPIVLSAHADDRGSREFNEDLSIRRGEAVKARLVAEGIDPDRIRVVPHGRDMRVADCQDPGCSAQNRRVVTVIGDVEPATIGATAGNNR